MAVTPAAPENPVESTTRAASLVCWLSTAVIAGFLVLAQGGAMLAVTFARPWLSWVAPVAWIASILIVGQLGQRVCPDPRLLRRGVGIACLSALVALGFSAFFYDFAWDGQWYHQTAIFALARDWNPVTDALRTFPDGTELWVRHYSKGPWYVAAAIYQTTGLIELGKCVNLLAWSALVTATLAVTLEWGLSRARAIAVTVIVALNPVVVGVLTCYLIEAVLGSFLVVLIAAMLAAMRAPRPLVIWCAVAALVIVINTKLTGIVFGGLIVAVGAIACAWWYRARLARFLALGALAGICGLALGVNPYVTNFMFRGNPFYPVLGSAEYPSLTTQGKEGIDLHETPKNVLTMPLVKRLGYSWFGRPGNAPYNKQTNAELMLPFGATWKDLFYYRYHETRTAGFGPWFGGALLLASALAVWVFVRARTGRAALALAMVALLGSMFLSRHLWWSRYAPLFWLFPLLPIVAAFLQKESRAIVRFAWVVAAILVINGVIVAGVRLKWEALASLKLRAQLTELNNRRQVVWVYPGWFSLSTEHRLQRWDVPYRLKTKKEIGTDTQDLISVIDGYPGSVRFKFPPR